jgi:hypothetical protein
MKRLTSGNPFPSLQDIDVYQGGATVAWIKHAGLPGKVFQPDDNGLNPKKHPCTACFACQWCDENRCRVCRSSVESVDADLGRSCGCRHQIGPTAKKESTPAPSAHLQSEPPESG